MIPRTSKEIVDFMIEQRYLTVADIASDVGVSKQTIYRIRHGFQPSGRIDVQLISLYLSSMKY